MLVPNVAGLDGIGLRLDPEHHVDNVTQRNVGGVRPMPAAPADVIANAIFGNAGERVIERIDPQRRVTLVVRQRRLRIKHVPGIRQAGIVELQHKAGVDDGPILNAQRLGDAFEECFGVGVMAILSAAEHFQAADRNRRDKGFFHAGRICGGL